jgi:hypothetical protein
MVFVRILDCDRAGRDEHGDFATEYGSPKAIVPTVTGRSIHALRLMTKRPGHGQTIEVRPAPVFGAQG